MSSLISVDEGELNLEAKNDKEKQNSFIKETKDSQKQQPEQHPLYENQESLKQDSHSPYYVNNEQNNNNDYINNDQDLVYNLNAPVKCIADTNKSLISEDNEPLPTGWEKVVDETHGIFYIDHNTQRTQYERPYEIQLCKGSMGFGFTLVETDNGLLLVRSIIEGGPAHQNGKIRPGDILISVVGISVSGLQHTDVAKLFSAFAVGDCVKLTFARSNYILDENLIPDVYVFSNGNPPVTLNPNNSNFIDNPMMNNHPNLINNQEFDVMKISIKKGDYGFGFILDSTVGQKIKEIKNPDLCMDLKQGDILLQINELDISQMPHQDVVACLDDCPVNQMAIFTIKRRKRFRSKTPMAIYSDHQISSPYDHHLHQRNCQTPTFDAMIRDNSLTDQSQPRSLSSLQDGPALVDYSPEQDQNYGYLPIPNQIDNPFQNVHSSLTQNGDLYINNRVPDYGLIGPSQQFVDNTYNNYRPSSTCTSNLPLDGTDSNIMYNNNTQMNLNLRNSLGNPASWVKFNNSDDLNHINQYKNFMNNDRLMIMQMQQQQQQQKYNHPNGIHNSDTIMHHSHFPTMAPQSQDYLNHHIPLYSNEEIPISAKMNNPMFSSYHPLDPIHEGNPMFQDNVDDDSNNYYANNEEIALQRYQNENLNQNNNNYPTQHQSLDYSNHHNHTQRQSSLVPHDNTNYHDLNGFGPNKNMMQMPMLMPLPIPVPIPNDDRANLMNEANTEEFEYHVIELDRESTDANWGIRLIGGAEVNRAISIGSVVFGGAAAKNGKLKSGDEIISINGIKVLGSTHKNVVDLISACTNRATIMVRRKKFAEACEVILTRNLDEGFGFVIISSADCALIGKIIEGSPADRCQQLHVRDRIIAVSGRDITPNMQHPEIVNMIKESGSVLRLKIIPADCYTVELIKNSPNDSFGFRMRGGSEYDGTGLYILRVAPYGLARDLLNVGDQIIEINGIPTVGMTHQQAASIIRHSDPIVKLKLRRNHVIPPSLLVDSPRELHRYNQVTAEVKPVDMPIPLALPPPPLPQFKSHQQQSQLLNNQTTGISSAAITNSGDFQEKTPNNQHQEHNHPNHQSTAFMRNSNSNNQSSDTDHYLPEMIHHLELNDMNRHANGTPLYAT